MAQLEVGQRVKILSKSTGESYRSSYTCRQYRKGEPVYINRILSDGRLRVGRNQALGGYFKPKDLEPWNNLEESEEL